MHRFGYSLFIGILLLAGSVGAQQAGQAAPQNPPDKNETKVPVFTTAVIVTGSKTDDHQETVTQKVTVISDDQLLAPTNIVRNVSELLQYQPGMSVTVLSRNDANWGSYGGLGPKYNSYLLDGLPIDSFVDTMSLDQWAFARVETHQGPASVMYSNYLSADFAGTQAPLAGITNLILKDRIDAPVTRVLLDGGSWNTLATRLYHQDHKGNLHYFFGATYEQSDYTDYGAPNSWLGMLDDPSYKKVKIYGKATYFAGSHQKFSVFAQHTLHDGFVGRPNRDYGHNYDTVNAVYANQVNAAWDIQLKTGLRNYDRRWGDDNYPTSLALVDHAGVQQQIIPTDLTVTLKHHGHSAFTVGTDFQHATYRTYTEANAPRTTGNDATSLSTGLYAQEKFVSGKWVARAGVRVNHIADTYALIGGAAPGLQEQSWTKGLWSTGVRYNVSKTLSAYANAGTSFISPAAKSVGGTLNPGDVGIVGRNGQLPNPDFQPESGLGSDFGIDLAIAASRDDRRPRLLQPDQRRDRGQRRQQHSLADPVGQCWRCPGFRRGTGLRTPHQRQSSRVLERDVHPVAHQQPTRPGPGGGRGPVRAGLSLQCRRGPESDRQLDAGDVPARGRHVLRQHVEERTIDVRTVPDAERQGGTGATSIDVLDGCAVRTSEEPDQPPLPHALAVPRPRGERDSRSGRSVLISRDHVQAPYASCDCLAPPLPDVRLRETAAERHAGTVSRQPR